MFTHETHAGRPFGHGQVHLAGEVVEVSQQGGHYDSEAGVGVGTGGGDDARGEGGVTIGSLLLLGRPLGVRGLTRGGLRLGRPLLADVIGRWECHGARGWDLDLELESESESKSDTNTQVEVASTASAGKGSAVDGVGGMANRRSNKAGRLRRSAGRGQRSKSRRSTTRKWKRGPSLPKCGAVF